MELPNIPRPRIVDLARIAMIDTCGRQSSLGVRKKPRYLKRVVGFKLCHLPVGSVYAVSSLGPQYLGGEKIISSVFSKSAVRPFWCSQLRVSSNFEMAFLQALYGVADTAIIAPSSTYRERDEWVHVELSLRRNEV